MATKSAAGVIKDAPTLFQSSKAVEVSAVKGSGMNPEMTVLEAVIADLACKSILRQAVQAYKSGTRARGTLGHVELIRWGFEPENWSISLDQSVDGGIAVRMLMQGRRAYNGKSSAAGKRFLISGSIDVKAKRPVLRSTVQAEGSKVESVNPLYILNL